MVSIANGTTDGTDKAEDQQQEYSRERCDSNEGGGEDGVGLGLFIVGKAEQRGLHAKGQQYQYECRVGIDVGADAVVARVLGHVMRIKRYEQVVQEPADDAGEAVDGRVFGE